MKLLAYLILLINILCVSAQANGINGYGNVIVGVNVVRGDKNEDDSKDNVLDSRNILPNDYDDSKAANDLAKGNYKNIIFTAKERGVAIGNIFQGKLTRISNKGIVDWVDGSKNDNDQRIALQNVSRFIFHVINEGVLK